MVHLKSGTYTQEKLQSFIRTLEAPVHVGLHKWGVSAPRGPSAHHPPAILEASQSSMHTAPWKDGLILLEGGPCGDSSEPGFCSSQRSPHPLIFIVFPPFFDYKPFLLPRTTVAPLLNHLITCRWHCFTAFVVCCLSFCVFCPNYIIICLRTDTAIPYLSVTAASLKRALLMVMISDTYSVSTNNKMDMPEGPLLFVGFFHSSDAFLEESVTN